MIRKNDSISYIGKWGRTITTKLNWHISEKSVYARNRKTKRGMIKVERGNWPRTIGIHYRDGTDRYQKQLISEYQVLKKIQRVIRKQKDIYGVTWPDKITFQSYNDFLNIISMAENIARKYGFKVIRSKHEEHFPWVEIERIHNHYIYPYL